MSEIYSIPVRTIDGQEQDLSPYRGQVLLVVNVASHCGFTGQYAGLEKLYQSYRQQGFSVLGFPCRQFANQEFSDNQQIQEFCSTKYRVTFPMFERIDVNGPHTHRLYDFLKRQAPGFLGLKRIAWNFTKFLVARDGQVLKRYGSIVTPEQLSKKIERLLK
mgnify:CR=1 FL=1